MYDFDKRYNIGRKIATAGVLFVILVSVAVFLIVRFQWYELWQIALLSVGCAFFDAIITEITTRKGGG